MGRLCAVFQCRRIVGSKLHVIPSKDPARSIWLEFITKANLKFKCKERKQEYVCDEHFIFDNDKRKRSRYPTLVLGKPILEEHEERRCAKKGVPFENMKYCLICEGPFLLPLGTDNHYSSAKATFLVKILLELGDSFESDNNKGDWWSVCEKCEGLIEECFKIYGQIVELCEDFRRKQVEFIDGFQNRLNEKCKSDGDENTVTSERLSNEDLRWGDLGRKFRRLIGNRDWKTHKFIVPIPHLENFHGYNELITVKEELESVTEQVDPECGMNFSEESTATRIKDEVDYDARTEDDDVPNISDEFTQCHSSDHGFKDKESFPELEATPSTRVANQKTVEKYDSSVKQMCGRRTLILPNMKLDPSTKTFRCPTCDFSSKWKFSTRNHYRRVHKKGCLIKAANVKCAVCEKEMKPGFLKRHMVGHEKRGSYAKRKDIKAKKEPPVKRPPPVLPRHKLDPESNKYRCPSCEYSSPRINTLRNHYKVEHLKEAVYTCTWPDCGKTFMKKNNYDGHVDRHKGTPRFRCEVCPEAFYTVNPLVRHRQKEHEGGQVNKQFMCDQCGKGYSNRDALYCHKHLVHSERIKEKRKRIVDCDICGKRCTTSSIYNHMKTDHGNVDPSRFKTCELCGKSLSLQMFPLHMRNVHQQFEYSGTWTCSECSHGFASKESLDIHLYAKHKIGEPLVTKYRSQLTWNCDVTGCRRKFACEEKFKVHMNDYHGPDKTKPGKFECRFCGSRFFWRIKLKHHEMIHENAETKPFQCEVCQKGFPTPVHLRYHLVNTHKMKMDNRQGYRHLQGQLTIPKT